MCGQDALGLTVTNTTRVTNTTPGVQESRGRGSYSALRLVHKISEKAGYRVVEQTPKDFEGPWEAGA